MRGAQRVVVGKPEVKGPPGKPRCRWEDNINTILKKSVGVAWTGLIWLRTGRSGGFCEKSNGPWGFTECKEFLTS